MATSAEPALLIEHVSKQFEAVRALDDVSFEVAAGSVHGVLGANGSGKSTLIKVLSGYHSPEPGARVSVHGEAVGFPIQTHGHGIAIVHQDLGLLPDGSILENVGVSSSFGATSRWLPVSWRNERRRVRAILLRLGVSLDVDRRVDSLKPAERTIVAIARAVRQVEFTRAEWEILLLDEPTVTLPPDGVEILFDLVRETAGRGGSVIFITHRLKEALAICDHVTVLRDGRVAADEPAAGSSVAALVRAMHEAALEELAVESRGDSAGSGRVVMRANSVCGPTIDNFSMDLCHGEVLGITGLAGMGQDELPYLLGGATPPASGSVAVGPEDLAGAGASVAWATGVALVPANRAEHAIWLDGSLFENFTITSLRSYLTHGRLASRRERSDTREAIRDFEIKAPGPDALMSNLSGGNQQKLVLARALAGRPRVLLLHEPFIGIDAAARAAVLRTIQDVAAEGCAVAIFSIEYELLADICDRVLVLSHGSMTTELKAGSLSEGEIARAAQHV